MDKTTIKPPGGFAPGGYLDSYSGIPGEIRTHDPLLRRQLLYPLSYRRPEHNDEFSIPNDQPNTTIGHCSFVIGHSGERPLGAPGED